MKNKKTKVWIIILLVSLAILVLLGLISSALEIGERLRNIHFSLEIAFYVLIAVVVIVGVVYPIVGVLRNPIFSLDQLHDVDGNVRLKWCKKLVNNLIENTELSEEEQIQVKGFLKDGNEADDRLIEFFDRKIAPEIKSEIFKTARRVFLVTAASQNAVIDMLGVLSLNFMLIRKITELCGFRPNNLQIVRLYIRVLSMTVLAGVLESINIEGIVTKVAEGFISAPFAPLIGVAVSSIMQGTTNALLTVRLGVMTKNFLLNADVSKTRNEIRKEALKEALSIFPSILKTDEEEKAKKSDNKIKAAFTKAKDKIVKNKA